MSGGKRKAMRGGRERHKCHLERGVVYVARNFRGMAEHFLQERKGNFTLEWHYTYVPLRITLLCSLVIEVKFIGACS
jgi:hypothetical protein